MISLTTKTSKTYDDIEFNFTGFGEFGGVKDNPTTHLVNYLKDNTDSLKNDFRIGQTTVVKVAAEDCIEYINETMPKLENKQKEEPSTRQILIHMGVNGGSKEISLEIHGYNNADFRIPDVRNYQPSNLEINSNLPLEHYHRTMFPVKSLVEKLSTKHKVSVSNDPGRYICNYIYYLSLTQGYQRGIPSIFIHVPGFAQISQEAQIEFVKDLMQELKSHYVTSSSGFLSG